MARICNISIRKYRVVFKNKYYKDNYNLVISDIPDYRSPTETKEHGKGIHWKRIAKCLEKNDYSCRSLSYGLTLSDKKEIKLLKKEYGDLIGIQTHTKEMKLLKEELDNEN
jgi:predicted phosphoadenosine phosphosulfate sulfurtransferase